MIGRRELLTCAGALALAPQCFAQSRSMAPGPSGSLAALVPNASDRSVLDGLPAILKAEFPATLSVRVTQRDAVLLDYQRDGVARDQLFRIYSVTKSVLAVLVGIAHDRGAIPSFDTSVASYFPELDLSTADRRAREVTIRNILTMTAGWDTSSAVGLQPPPTTTSGFFRPFAADPGTSFIYDNNATNILGILLARALGRTLDAFAEEALLGPLGITDHTWRKTPDGYAAASGGLSLSIDSLTRFGRLAMRGGEWNGGRIVSRRFVDEMLSRRIGVNAQESLDYGYLWFVQRTADGRRETFIAQGYGGQVLQIVPELDLIVATTTEPGDKASARFIRGMILPSMRG